MKDIPILLSGPMVRAFLEGRKTQTRRLTNRFNAQPGDRIWFKETFIVAEYRLFRADFNDAGMDALPELEIKAWKPSIFMPKTICRCWAEIVEVREEPLMDITSEDVLDEGIPLDDHKCGCERCAYTSELCPATQSSLICAYAELWDGLHKKPIMARFANNPPVFVFTFKKIKP